MANIKLQNNNWEASGIYDIDQQKTQRQINSEQANLKSAILINDGQYPLIEINEWVDGEYVDSANGSFISYPGWHRSGYIEIGNADKGILHFHNTKNARSLYNVFYNESYTKVGYNFDTNDVDIPIPEGAVYFAVSIESSYGVSAVKPIVELINRATKESVDYLTGKYNTNELIFSIIKNSYVDLSNEGVFAPFSGWDRTDYISLENYNCILVRADKTSIYNAFYDGNHEFIKSVKINQGENIIYVPSNAYYIVFSGERNYTESIKVIKWYSDSENTFMQDECLLLRNNLPSYYTSYPANPQNYNSGAYIDIKAGDVQLKNKNFIFITDVHWPSNSKQSNKLIAYLRKKLHIDNVIHGGDVINYDQDDPYLASVHMREWIDEARAACGSGLLPVQGNHDVNTGSGRTDEETQQDIMPYSVAEKIQLSGSKPFIVQETDAEIEARISSITFDTDADRNDVIEYYKLHYYCDDHKRKIRYIVLNHGTHLNGIIYKYFNVRQFDEVFLQMDWLYSVLMSTPNDYTVVVAMHAFINYGTNRVQSGPLQVCYLLSGFKTKNQNCRITNANNISGTVYPYGYHYYDFSAAPTPNGIICLGGDMHWDYAYVVRTAEGAESGPYTDALADHADSIVVVHTQTDAYARTYPPGTHLSDTWSMTPGTITEQCFDIVSIEPYNNNYAKAKFTRIGAGEDREFHLNLQT